MSPNFIYVYTSCIYCRYTRTDHKFGSRWQVWSFSRELSPNFPIHRSHFPYIVTYLLKCYGYVAPKQTKYALKMRILFLIWNLFISFLFGFLNLTANYFLIKYFIKTRTTNSYKISFDKIYLWTKIPINILLYPYNLILTYSRACFPEG